MLVEGKAVLGVRRLSSLNAINYILPLEELMVAATCYKTTLVITAGPVVLASLPQRKATLSITKKTSKTTFSPVLSHLPGYLRPHDDANQLGGEDLDPALRTTAKVAFGLFSHATEPRRQAASSGGRRLKKEKER